jgi:phosphatidylserine/phosphatidylglycerophosphate/cardiolipin synthase-like enzyme
MRIISALVIFATQFLILNAWGVQNLQTCFSPAENCDKEIVEYIRTAKTSIDMAIYSLALQEIRQALLDAKQRGVKIRIVADQSQSEGQTSKVPAMITDGFDLRFGVQKGVMHNKFTIVDGAWVETGSYNYSYSASRLNAENQIYLKDAQVVSRYQSDFEKLWTSGTQAP